MDLRDYEQHKFSIAEVLRSASRLVPHEQYEQHRRIDELFARLAEDRFNLVVVGRFNRGKTSLMNAIMATDRLPTGIVPLTSVITTVAYGSKEQAVLSYEGRIFTQEIAIEALPQYITQDGNPGNVQRIKKAEIQLPAEILRRGFHFVDTPGLGSAITENTRTTEAFLPEADAFLLVTSYESPLSDEELRFCRIAASSGRRVFVALNKQDTASADDRRTVFNFVRRQLSALLGDEPKIFSVSARDGLEAKLAQDKTRLNASGLPPLERELIHFMLAEKSAEFLHLIWDRTTGLVRELVPEDKADELLQPPPSFVGEVVREDHDVRSNSQNWLNALTNGSGLHKLQPCEICEQTTRVLWDFLCHFQYDVSVSQAVQDRLAENGGLCSFHAWEVASISSPQGICTGYPTLLSRFAATLRDQARAETRENTHPKGASAPSSGETHCAVCAVRLRAEREAISDLAARLANKRTSVDSLSAICLPHLGGLASKIDDTSVIRKLFEREATILERLAEDMKRYALKRDAARRNLLSDEEEAAAQWAIRLLAGHRMINATCKCGAADPRKPLPSLVRHQPDLGMGDATDASPSLLLEP
jgi:small GTP-binding protein